MGGLLHLVRYSEDGTGRGAVPNVSAYALGTVLSNRWCSDTNDSDSRFQRGVSDAVGGRDNYIIYLHRWSGSLFLHVLLQLCLHTHLHRRFSRESLL